MITDFDEFLMETDRDDFKYVVPDFRLNKTFDRLGSMTCRQKDKVEFLCNECCWFGCNDRKNAMKLSAVKILGRIYLNIYAVLPVLTKVIDFPKQ